MLTLRKSGLLKRVNKVTKLYIIVIYKVILNHGISLIPTRSAITCATLSKWNSAYFSKTSICYKVSGGIGNAEEVDFESFFISFCVSFVVVAGSFIVIS